MRTLVLDVPDWPGHLAGQHVDVRLTAEDGYTAERSYSLASPPEDGRVVLGVERIEDGEVSPYLVDEALPGDRLEVRGPVGRYFVWESELGGPVLLVGGGSGIVPLAAILRHRLRSGSDAPVRLLASWRTPADVVYRGELDSVAAEEGIDVVHTFTRAAPPGWSGYARRIDEGMLREVAWPAASRPQVYVCGPTGLVEAAAAALVSLGHDPAQVRTERFG
ncbi:MAG TPA: FAD-binding oxidoreductase [Gaiellaceae bacterium]|nr:FAD-binding oxidoreductase [Gaiellaceae bacterium]